jgi:hypothetical protein
MLRSLLHRLLLLNVRLVVLMVLLTPSCPRPIDVFGEVSKSLRFDHYKGLEPKWIWTHTDYALVVVSVVMANMDDG